MQRRLNVLAIVGLALGAVFGLAGTLVEQATVRSLFWGIDGAGLVMAACLLAVKYFRRESDIVAAGFLVFAVGEGLILSGAAAGLDESRPSFAAGTALWATALLLVSIPREFPIAVRGIGIASAILFGITAVLIFSGSPISPLSSPLPFFAYPFLVLTFVGWIWILRRENASTLPR